MPKIRIMTFNVENLLARFNFSKWEEESLATLLDVESDLDRANLIRTHWNVVNAENRVFTALSIAEGTPHVVCLQEVENLPALKRFHDVYLRRTVGYEFPHKLLVDGNDPRGIDVALLSRAHIDSFMTHQDRTKPMPYLDDDGELQPGDPDNPRPLFRRDCLEVRVKRYGKPFTIFVCHFKSMMGGRENTRPIREAEAAEVRAIIEERFPDDPADADWLVVGDLNDYTFCIDRNGDLREDDEHGLGVLLDPDFSENLVKRIDDASERWTHFYKGESHYTQLDYILASRGLAERNQAAVPEIIRSGMPYRAALYDGQRHPRVGYDEPKASDHCPVVVELEY